MENEGKMSQRLILVQVMMSWPTPVGSESCWQLGNRDKDQALWLVEWLLTQTNEPLCKVGTTWDLWLWLAATALDCIFNVFHMQHNISSTLHVKHNLCKINDGVGHARAALSSLTIIWTVLTLIHCNYIHRWIISTSNTEYDLQFLLSFLVLQSASICCLVTFMTPKYRKSHSCCVVHLETFLLHCAVPGNGWDVCVCGHCQVANCVTRALTWQPV